MAAKHIQRMFRGYRGRKTLMNMKFELIVIYVQSLTRMFLAKLEKKRRLK